MALIRQSTLTRSTFSHASSPDENSEITHWARAQHVLKCFAGPGPIAVNTALSPAWEPYGTHGHTPTDGEHYSSVYLGICLWEAKVLCTVFPHCLWHLEHHSDMSCLDFCWEEAGGKECVSFHFNKKKEGISSIIVFLEDDATGEKQQLFCDNSPGMCLKRPWIWNAEDSSLGIKLGLIYF